MNRLSRFTALALGLALASVAVAQQQTSPSSAPAQPAPSQGQAQGKGQHMADPQQQLAHLSKQLQLTADQQAKIGPILQSRDQQVQALRADASLSPSDRRAKMMTIVQGSTQQIDALLTDAQRAQWKAAREKAMERQQERRSQGVPSSPSSNGG
jgi:periplasmic protein CpxP/Spy